MPQNKGNSCELYREQLIERLLDGQTQPFDTPVGDHLAACSACRSFWAALTALKPGFALPDFYKPGLRYRTLKRLAAEAEPVDRGFLSFMIPVSLLSLLLWFAIPLLLLTRLLDYWLARSWLSLLLSLLLLTSLGFLVGCLAFLGLTRGNGAEQLKAQMKDLLEGFHA